MWTRLVAGAAAHDINNLVQGLDNLLSFASAPTTSREALVSYAALARDGIDGLRRLGADLRALASVPGVVEPQRLDVVVLEAVKSLGTPADCSLDVIPFPSGALVGGPGATLRLAVHAVVKYALAASTPGGSVSVSVAFEDEAAAVVVSAPTAAAPRSEKEADLGALLGGADREFGGDVGLVLAGAAAHLCGGWISAAPAPAGGLRFKLRFPRAASPPDPRA